MRNTELAAIAKELPRGTNYHIDYVDASTKRPSHYIASAGDKWRTTFGYAATPTQALRVAVDRYMGRKP